MGIYFWDNGTRVDTRKGEALIYPQQPQDPQAAEALREQLESAGYHVSPARIPQRAEHTLTLRGFKDAGQQQALLKTLQARADRYGVAVNVSQSTITLEGLESQAQVESVQRWLQRKGFKPSEGAIYNHTVQQPEPLVGLHLRDVKDEGAVLDTLEQQGWARGERKDEFHGMSGIQKQWSRMVKAARKFVGIFFLAGDAQIIASNVVDSKRRGIPFYKNESFSEGVGFAIGSSAIILDTEIAEPASSEDVVQRFKANFQVGNHYDYTGKHENFDPEGASLGRAADAAKGVIKNNSIELLMLVDFWSGSGIWRGRYSKIMRTEEAGAGDDAVRNVVVEEHSGQAAQDSRLKWNDAISGVLYPTAAAVTLLPQEGAARPFFNPPRMGEQAQRSGLLAPVWRALGSFKEQVLDPTLLRPVNALMDWLSVDPYKVGGRIFMLHNLNQVGFGFWNVWQRTRDINRMEKQFAHEAEALGQDRITAAAQQGRDASLNVKFDSLTEPQKALLGRIYDLKDSTSYVKYIAEFREKLGVPSDMALMRTLIQQARDGKLDKGSALGKVLYPHVEELVKTFAENQHVPTDEQVKVALDTLCSESHSDFLEAFRTKKASFRNTDYHPTDEERFLMVKAMNRLYLHELVEEKRTALLKFGGYATFLAGNLMLSHAGEGSYGGVQNAMEKQVNLFAVVERVAEELHQAGQANDVACHNAALYLYQDKAIQPFGYSVAELESMLREAVEGGRAAEAERALGDGAWLSMPVERKGNIIAQENPNAWREQGGFLSEAQSAESGRAKQKVMHMQPDNIAVIGQEESLDIRPAPDTSLAS